MTELEIREAVARLVAAYKAHDRLQMIAHETSTRESAARLATNLQVMETVATDLATTALVDLHRIADALELVAARLANANAGAGGGRSCRYPSSVSEYGGRGDGGRGT